MVKLYKRISKYILVAFLVIVVGKLCQNHLRTSISALVNTKYYDSFAPRKTQYQHQFMDKSLRNRTVIAIQENEIDFILSKNCEFDFTFYEVILGNGNVIPMDIYKIYLMNKFIEKYSNHPRKSGIRSELPSLIDKPMSVATSRLNNVKEKIDFAVIEKNLHEEKSKRLKFGDDDLFKIKEVLDELTWSNYSVPNIVHFIWFGCYRRFMIHHYISVLSAYKYQRPRVILFHFDCEPVGEYWNILKVYLGKNFKMVKRSQPDQIWGLGINIIEHRADVARLQIMLEVGGIYLDTDSVVLKSTNPLRYYNITLGQEMPGSLANGMILANRNAWFLKRWYWEYRYFQDNQWGLNSVLVPWSLWRIFPEAIHVEVKHICRPGYFELNLIYREVYDWHYNYMIHLYASSMLYKDGTSERSLKELAILNSTYGQIARHVIWGDEKPRNITDWLVTCNMTKYLFS